VLCQLEIEGKHTRVEGSTGDGPASTQRVSGRICGILRAVGFTFKRGEPYGTVYV